MNINDPVVIKRNGVDKQLTKMVIVKGNKVGKEYLAPSFSIETIDADIEWVGKATVLAILTKAAKIAYQDIWFGCFADDGVFNDALFLKQAEEFTQSGLKLAEINEQLDEAQAKQGQLISTAKTDAEGMFTDIEEIRAIKENSNNIRALRAMRDARSKKGKADEAADPSVPVVEGASVEVAA